LYKSFIKDKTSKQTPLTYLKAHLTNRLVDIFAQDPDFKKSITDLSHEKLMKIANSIQQFKIMISGSEGYRKAEVTVGGIDTNELSSKTMECKKVPNLFCIGEVVDVTGWLGGYNFQWAWASGFAAGTYC
jgi:predicted Rossmann fold flavoprotein